MKLNYDVEADWVLLTACNLRCDYCFVSLTALGARVAVHGTNAQWADAFDAGGKTWLLHITGGEPFIYPDFVNLCERLAQKHFLSINSNLSHRSVVAFANAIDPARVHYVHAALHYAERATKASLQAFVDRVRLLQDRRFNVLVSAVMTPAMVEVLPKIAADLEAQGIFLIPKVMRAKYGDRRYPAAYTSTEKRLTLAHLAHARDKCSGLMRAMGETPTLNLLADGRFFGNYRRYRGKLCGSGFNFVRIEPDGAVLRCGSGESLGNTLAGNVRLLKAPKLCDTTYCPYFCEKYTSPPFVPAHPAKGSLVRSLTSMLGRVPRA
jgi:MoaA/NifB/PqqE/SkfB family radical SAM enzyme